MSSIDVYFRDLVEGRVWSLTSDAGTAWHGQLPWRVSSWLCRWGLVHILIDDRVLE